MWKFKEWLEARTDILEPIDPYSSWDYPDNIDRTRLWNYPSNLGVKKGRQLRGEEEVNLPRGFSIVPRKDMIRPVVGKIDADISYNLSNANINLFDNWSFVELNISISGQEPLYFNFSKNNEAIDEEKVEKLKESVNYIYDKTYDLIVKLLKKHYQENKDNLNHLCCSFYINENLPKQNPWLISGAFHKLGENLTNIMTEALPEMGAVDELEIQKDTFFPVYSQCFIKRYENKFDWRPDEITPEDYYA